MMVKCVIWDLDHTLLSGVYLESGAQPPPPDPAMLGVLEQLRGRGIIHAIATRNPPEAARYAARVTGMDFAAAECGWGRKSDAVRRIITDLGLAPDAVAFVDDDLYERPEDMAEAVGWPEFSPATVTAEARRRGEMYAERRRRQEEARAFAGSRDEFLRYCGTAVTITPAVAADAPRLHELSVRTHQFNTTGEAVAEAALRALIASPAHRVTTVCLSDRFGDDGLVGGSIVEFGAGVWGGRPPEASTAEPGPGRVWAVTLLMMSCRAMGRGVIEALLAWLARSAARDGAAELAVPCLVTPRNVPLRLALAASGFRAPGGSGPSGSGPRGFGGIPREGTVPGDTVPPRDSTAGGGSPGGAVARFSRTLGGPLPDMPDWVTSGAEAGPAAPDER
jgi:methoxymalonate biosynthesis protein